MTIVMSDACTINVSRAIIDGSRSINYKNIVIVKSCQNEATGWSVTY